MGMRVDAAKARKTLYGITAGMANHELVQYSGYGVSTSQINTKNPENIKRRSRSRKRETRRRRRTKENMPQHSKKISPSNGKKPQIGLKSMPAGRNEVKRCF